MEKTLSDLVAEGGFETLADFARTAGVKATTVYNLVHGKTAIEQTRVRTVVAMARTLNMSVGKFLYLLTGDEGVL